jgi:uncharacterized protein (TIGR02453 family)
MHSEAAIFSTETLDFLRNLRANNNRDWFQSNKAVCESTLKVPLLAFATALSEGIAAVAPEYATAPEKAVQRIYRDVRFSADKTPYRTELGILFTHRSLGKKAGAGLYVSISPDAVQVAGGVYLQDGPSLYAIRQHLLEHLGAFEKLSEDKALRKSFGELTGNSLQRPPRGLPPNHPAIELLKRTQWLLELKLPPETVTAPDFLGTVLAKLHLLLPFLRFFEPPLLAKAKPQHLD